MKALVGAFNQEKALVGDFSVIVKTDCGTDGSFHSTSYSGQEIRGDRGEMRRIAIVPAMRSDAGGYQEDAATQPPPPAQGYWRPAGAGAGLPADAEAASCCCCAGLVLGLCC